jgi:hypothetical protein
MNHQRQRYLGSNSFPTITFGALPYVVSGYSGIGEAQFPPNSKNSSPGLRSVGAKIVPSRVLPERGKALKVEIVVRHSQGCACG